MRGSEKIVGVVRLGFTFLRYVYALASSVFFSQLMVSNSWQITPELPQAAGIPVIGCELPSDIALCRESITLLGYDRELCIGGFLGAVSSDK